MRDREAVTAASAAIRFIAAQAEPGAPLEPSARVALHFHPDFDQRGRPALINMIHDRKYVSQFVTGTSNGGLTAQPGGDRWNWEHQLYGGAYDDAAARDRPVYGALLVDDDGYGPSPRFGSAYFRLRPSVVRRSTFTYPDSGHSPTAFGVADRMGLVAELSRRNPDDDPLSHYIEAQVHGGITLPDDVEALVLDPSFIGSDLDEPARSIGIPVEWHAGYSLNVEIVASHPEYRGIGAVGLARRLAQDGTLTPELLGRARGRDDVKPQLLKFVWHYLARYGRVDPGADDSAPGSSRG